MRLNFLHISVLTVLLSAGGGLINKGIAQTVPFDKLDGIVGPDKSINWNVNGTSGKSGHRFVNGYYNGIGYLNLERMHNGSLYTNLMYFTSDGIVGLNGRLEIANSPATTPTTPSPGFGGINSAGDGSTFDHYGEKLNQYGLGFRLPSNQRNLYLSSWFGVDIFTANNHNPAATPFIPRMPSLRVADNGFVGINCLPNARLDVNSGAGGTVIRGLGGVSTLMSLDLGRTATEFQIGLAGASGNFATQATAGDAVIKVGATTNRLLLGTGTNAPLAIYNGKVGIGTNTPNVLLDVRGGKTYTDDFEAQKMMVTRRTTGANLGGGILYFQHENVKSHQLRYEDGKFYLEKIDLPGWGTTTTPELYVGGLIGTRKFEFNRASTVSTELNGITAGGSGEQFLYDLEYLNRYGLGIHLYDDKSGTSGSGGENLYLSSYWGMDFFTNGRNPNFPVMRLNRNGNVGIGTNDPKHILQIGDANSDVSLSLRGPNTSANSSALVFEDVQGTTKDWFKVYHNSDLDQLVIGSYDKDRMMVFNRATGTVGIGFPSSRPFNTPALNPNGYTLAVNGIIGTKEVLVENTSATWPDYVFKPEYKKRSLEEVEEFVKEHNHLPEIPSAAEIDEKGIKLGEMNAALLKKIEELTLYLIEQDKRIKELEQKQTESRK